MPALAENVEIDGQIDSSGPGFWTLVREDWLAHGRDWTLPGFRAVVVCRFGQWRMRIRPKVLRAPVSVFYRMLFRFVRNHYGIELPYSVEIGRRVVIEHQGAIVIHGRCRIGDDCIIRQGVTLGNRRLDAPDEAPALGIGVNVGAGAKILGNIHIGDRAQIGANAVVLHDVPAGALAVGVPASIVEPADHNGTKGQADAGRIGLPTIARWNLAKKQANRRRD